MAKAKEKSGKGDSTIALNKRARHEYHIDERYEAGLSLQGWEVKSLRAGRINLAEAYAIVKNGEIFLFGASIPPLLSASTHVVADDRRTRKLLLHRAGDRQADRRGRAQGLHDRADRDVLEAQPRQGRDRASPRASRTTTSAPPRRNATGIARSSRPCAQKNPLG